MRTLFNELANQVSNASNIEKYFSKHNANGLNKMNSREIREFIADHNHFSDFDTITLIENI